MSKILIADDEQKIRRLVCDFLKNSGYETVEVDNGDDAFSLFKNSSNDISLLILDIMMPGLNGWEVCRKVRETSDVPVIILTARSQEFDELMGYESGADDYVTKPFSPSILVKKVEALLRRYESSVEQPAKSPCTSLVINHEAHEVKLDGKTIDLTLKEYDILKKLVEAPGRVFSREQLLDSIWGYDYVGDIRTVDSHVARLRTKLGEWGNKNLKTVYGVGYKIEGTE
ncbi:MAG: response regulator transcription factor [Faecalibacterium sp.]|nr:response regulator transcription factor [Ruminococcus sp.]MCM1391621.1 response regulator transcription factor [Ruminococcus sp.]MCM1484917.1 response regulator transcription factor [Faecalibacterium sp.]